MTKKLTREQEKAMFAKGANIRKMMTHEQMEEMGLNTCDKCGEIDKSEELVWITSDDFEPREGEIVPKKLYSRYDALCEDCYLKSIKRKK